MRQDERPQEAVSFGGKPLYRIKVNNKAPHEIARKTASLEQKDALTANEYIELAAHYIKAGRYQDTIALYAKGIEVFPNSFKLRRHRGHRYINVRELDKAIIDLEQALEIIGENTTQVFQKKADGSPHGTYEYWVWYHIGIYHYLQGNYHDAVFSFEKCKATASNNDLLIGAVDWLYNSLVKSGNAEKAKSIAASIDQNINADKTRSIL